MAPYAISFCLCHYFDSHYAIIDAILSCRCCYCCRRRYAITLPKRVYCHRRRHAYYYFASLITLCHDAASMLILPHYYAFARAHAAADAHAITAILPMLLAPCCWLRYATLRY